ncbi:hypothetical protein BX666DRAFT_1888332 [Dichotomocladium elegans]|nr:hypothetical protein BX666DRAFT_1888332 [Dichotomocladium elegans]
MDPTSNNPNPYDIFDFEYPLQFDNDFSDPTLGTDVILQGTTESIPDNLFQFITNEQGEPNVIDLPAFTNPATEITTPTSGVSLATSQATSQDNQQQQQRQQQQQQRREQEPVVGQKRPRDESEDEPANQTMFVLVVGGRPFRLSWESLTSDGPDNFFTNFFRKRKNTRVMHIDRDPGTFVQIVHHLRGYYVRPRDDIENQALLSDAEYYGLKRLLAFLQKFLFINVGGRVFWLQWSLLRKDGGSRNFFTGPMMHQVFNPHGNSAQAAPIYIDRDPDIFADIITHLRGYTVNIRDEVHRTNLLKDAQYYALRGLREKLMTSRRTLDGFGDHGCREVLLLLKDVRLVNVLPPASKEDGRLRYKRDDLPHALLVQISDFCLQIHSDGSPVIELGVEDKQKLQDLGEGVALQGIQDGRVMLDEACAMAVDDRQVRHVGELAERENWEACQRECGPSCRALKLSVQKAIAGVHVDNQRLVLCLVRFEAISSRFQLNMKREFLPS